MSNGLVFQSLVCNIVLYLSLGGVCLLAQNPIQPGQLATTSAQPAAAPYTPISNLDKFKYRIVESVELRGFAVAAVGASVEQVIHTPPEWGKGAEGYAKRYASTFGAAFTRQTLDYGMESMLHEDPRYFPLDGHSTKSRIWNALKQTFVTRTDSGDTTFAYGRIASAVATGQIARTWLPVSNNSAVDGLRTGGISIGIDAAVNLLYEFVPASRPNEINHH